MADFASYGLRDNPFDPGVQSPFVADRQDELNALSRSLQSAFRSRAARFILITGDYGVGKTHMLNHIYRQFSEAGTGAKGVFAVKGVLFDRPLAVMETEPRWAKFGLSLVCRIFDNIERERMQEAFSKVPAKQIRGTFAQLFSALKEGHDVAFSYMAGERLTASELKMIGMRGALQDSPSGLNLFFEWLRLIGLAGYHTFLVLIDEFEYIPQVLGETKVSQVLNTFREIFDRSTHLASQQVAAAKPVFVFAVSPDGWNRLTDLAQAAIKKAGGGGIAPFMRRLSPRDRIDLGPFSLQDTKELVRLRLDNYRTEASQEPLAPFTDDAIEYVHSASFNKPANVIQYCSILLEDALLEGLDRVTREDTVRLLSKYGIRPPETGA